MPELRLPKLPDRTPVKIGISVNPDLHSALMAYADAYHAIYGTAETIAELIPYMLAAFIEGDSGFKKARRDRDLSAGENSRTPAGQVRKRRSTIASTVPSISEITSE